VSCQYNHPQAANGLNQNNFIGPGAERVKHGRGLTFEAPVWIALAKA